MKVSVSVSKKEMLQMEEAANKIMKAQGKDPDEERYLYNLNIVTSNISILNAAIEGKGDVDGKR